MKTKGNWLIALAILITGGCMIVDKYNKLPDYVGYIVAGIAVAVIVVFTYINRSVISERGNKHRLK